MNDDRNQNQDKPQDERFLSGDLIFSLNLIKYSFDSEKKNQRWMVAPKPCHECATTKVVVALDLVVSAMYSALHSNFFSVLCSDILACFHSSLELFYSTLQLANN